jgi:methylenetetrahydrofolate reductase (NADPH)
VPSALPQFEVIPLRGIETQVREHLPTGSRVTVTASPAQGLDTTVRVASTLAGHGMIAIPHLAARMVRGPGELSELLEQLTRAGISEVFVIAGDAPEAAGPYPDALALLEALTAAEARPTLGIGVHPEGHPFLDEEEAMARLREKAQLAHYAVTQMCFSAAPLLNWLEQTRAAGISLPVRPGIAGPVGIARLLRIGARIGVGRSLRMLSGEDSPMRRLLSPDQWDPQPLLTELRAATAEQQALGLLGPHLYTFNQLDGAADSVATG